MSNPILSLTNNDFCILFSKEQFTEQHLFLEKCTQLGISGQSDYQNRKVFYYETAIDQQFSAISEKHLKEWINQHGSSELAEEAAGNYEKWELIFFSEDTVNQELATLLLNTFNDGHRPSDKYFALWIALAIFGKNESTQLTARQLLSIYLTKEELEHLQAYKLSETITAVMSNTLELPYFINFNAIFQWKEKLKLSSVFFSGPPTQIFTKGIEEFIKDTNLTAQLAEVQRVELAFQKGENLKWLKWFTDGCPDLTTIRIYREDAYQLSKKEVALFDCYGISLHNCLLPNQLDQLPCLDKVKSIQYSSPQDVYFSDTLFPNLQSLKLTGATIQSLDLTKSAENLLEIELTAPSQTQLPESIYNCQNLGTLHLHQMKIEAIDARFSQLTNLTSLCTRGSKFSTFPTPFFTVPKLNFLWSLEAPFSPIDTQAYPTIYGIDRIDFTPDTIQYFPYSLSVLPKLSHINIEKNSILQIDNRIANFKELTTLTIREGQLASIPDSLRLVPDLQLLSLPANQITAISFAWIVHIYTQDIKMDLTENPINRLPDIPIGFVVEKDLKRDKLLYLPKNNFTFGQLEPYQRIFGEEFIYL
ncbi:MAG: Leucine-rich repeat (LRR) protein [Paraglaciecola sp.]|jgi:Leucine-rich repeat (LRR) protein